MTTIARVPATPARTRAREIARWLALGAVAGPLLFTLAWVVLGVLSPGFTIFGTRIAPYSPISAGISGLGLGRTGPYMNAAFVCSGLLLLAGVIGAVGGIREMSAGARWCCSVLLGLSALGLVLDGLFTLESFLPHLLAFLLATGAPVLSFVVTGLLLRRIPRWRRYGTWLLIGSPLTLALLVLYLHTFSPTAAGARTGVAGLTERILVVEILAWFVALGWLAFARQEP
jgi:hypothetical membrane protein